MPYWVNWTTCHIMCGPSVIYIIIINRKGHFMCMPSVIKSILDHVSYYILIKYHFMLSLNLPQLSYHMWAECVLSTTQVSIFPIEQMTFFQWTRFRFIFFIGMKFSSRVTCFLALCNHMTPYIFAERNPIELHNCIPIQALPSMLLLIKQDIL